jgi:glycosyltransferase involved in cell wall biosynthesis
MKIVQIVDVRWYNACADFAIQQALGLLRLGHEVLLMANPGSPPAAKARDAGLDVTDDVDFASKNIIRSVRRLQEIVKDFRPDIIFAHRGESHLIGALAARRTGCPIARFRGDVRSPRGGMFSRILNDRMTQGIAVSTVRLKNEYESRFRLNGIPLTVIYPGIDSSRFRTAKPRVELKAQFGLDPERNVIGIVGRLSPVKGHRYFLQAARIVSEKNPDIQFVIAGEDAQISALELKEYAKSFGLANLHFFGLIENVEDLISSFDIGVIASVGSEMICRVLMEYFAAGISVVATRVNQLEELINLSGAGLMVPPGDPRAMGEAILELIEDESKRAAAATASGSWVRAYGTLERLGRDTEVFLRQVIDG